MMNCGIDGRAWMVIFKESSNFCIFKKTFCWTFFQFCIFSMFVLPLCLRHFFLFLHSQFLSSFLKYLFFLFLIVLFECISFFTILFVFIILVLTILYFLLLTYLPVISKYTLFWTISVFAVLFFFFERNGVFSCFLFLHFITTNFFSFTICVDFFWTFHFFFQKKKTLHFHHHQCNTFPFWTSALPFHSLLLFILYPLVLFFGVSPCFPVSFTFFSPFWFFHWSWMSLCFLYQKPFLHMFLNLCKLLLNFLFSVLFFLPKHDFVWFL